ncbi:MAG: YtxH domain-containing protein [Desulfuromonadales bacterium]|nr:MAG: YtxH domain-containing protein [Desulfuromonadales bacterium]
MSEERNNTVVVGALMLIAGGILGAGTALLFAPQSGRKTRRDIGKYVRKTRNEAEEMVEDFSDKVSDVVENLNDRTQEILGKGKEISLDVKKDLLKAFEEGKERLEKEKARLAKMLS